MTPDFDDLFPDDIPDETAAVLTEFLHRLVHVCEGRYLGQLLRHHRSQVHYDDPDAPWKPPPRNRT
jgi:hypothetical protein